MAFQQSTAVFLAVLPHRMSLQMARLVLCHSDVRRRYANSWAGYAVAVRFRASPSGYLVLVAAVKHLGPCRSGTARASTAQRAGVPCAIMPPSTSDGNTTATAIISPVCDLGNPQPPKRDFEPRVLDRKIN